MAKKDRSVIKTYFETGDVPTQSQFGDSFDSQVFWNDDVKTTTAGNSDNEVPTTKAVNDAIAAVAVPTLQEVTDAGSTTTNQIEIVKGPDDGGLFIKGTDLQAKVYVFNNPDNAGQIVVYDEANVGVINIDGFLKRIQVSSGTSQVEIFGDKLKIDNTHDVNYPNASGTLALLSDIPNTTTLVPYTGATNDVDLGSNALNAGRLMVNGTGGAGNIGLKHQSANPTAGGSESALAAGSSGQPLWKNAANAVETLAYKSYVDSAISSAVVGLLDDRGNYDASGNVYPSSGGSGTAGAILKGDLWTISVAGTLGGVAVTIGDVVRALIDTPGQTSSNWVVTENNIGYVPENTANKSTTTADSASTTKFPVWSAVVSYVTGLGYLLASTAATTYQAILTAANFGAFINGLTAKTTPVDADSISVVDSAASNVQKKVSLTDLWTNYIKGKTDAQYISKSMPAYSIYANNTNATANAAAATFKAIAKQTYSGAITWTGTTAPSGTTSHSYSWCQVGNQVTFNLVLFYGTAGSALTQVVCALPSDMPSPVKPDGITNTSEMICALNAHMSTGSSLGAQAARGALRIDSSSTSNFQIQVAVASAGYKVVWITGNYLTT